MWHNRLVCMKPIAPLRSVPVPFIRCTVLSATPAPTNQSRLHSCQPSRRVSMRLPVTHNYNNALTNFSPILPSHLALQPTTAIYQLRQFTSTSGDASTSQSRSDVQKPNLHESSTTTTTTATQLPWLIRHCPPSLLPYMQLARVDKPVGTWLLLMPCYWGIALATPAGSLPDLSLLAIMSIGAFVMRGAGCTINDLWDRDFDKQVARTKTRPLAAGTVTVPQALTFLAGQLAVGLAVVIQLDLFTIGVAMASMPLVIAYPLMKRFTHWPQFVLGLTFNWGIWVGYSSVCHTIDSIALLPMYAASVCWTLVYDSIYAHQDIEDDKKIGVKSTAIAFGDHSKRWLSTFGIATMTGLAAVAPLADLGLIYQTIAIGGGSMHMLHQLMTVDLKDGGSCHRTFVSNVKFAWIIFLGIVLDRLFAEKKKSVQIPKTQTVLLEQ